MDQRTRGRACHEQPRVATAAETLAQQPRGLLLAVLGHAEREGRAGQSALRAAAAIAGHALTGTLFERTVMIPLLCAGWLRGCHNRTSAARPLDFVLTPPGAQALARLRAELGAS